MASIHFKTQINMSVSGHIILGLWAIMVLIFYFLFVPFVGIYNDLTKMASIHFKIQIYMSVSMMLVTLSWHYGQLWC